MSVRYLYFLSFFVQFISSQRTLVKAEIHRTIEVSIDIKSIYEVSLLKQGLQVTPI